MFQPLGIFDQVVCRPINFRLLIKINDKHCSNANIVELLLIESTMTATGLGLVAESSLEKKY